MLDLEGSRSRAFAPFIRDLHPLIRDHHDVQTDGENRRRTAMLASDKEYAAVICAGCSQEGTVSQADG